MIRSKVIPMRCYICGRLSSIKELASELWSNGERLAAICHECGRAADGDRFINRQGDFTLPILPGHFSGPDFCVLPAGYKRPLRDTHSDFAELANLIELGRWKAACRFQRHIHTTTNLLNALVKPSENLSVPLLLSPPATRAAQGVIEFSVTKLPDRLATHKDSIRAMGLLIEAGVLSSMSAWNSERR